MKRWRFFIATVLTLLCVVWVDFAQAKPWSKVSQRSLSATAAQTDCRQTGWFYISPTLKLCDPKGKVFVPVGTNIMPHYADEPMLEDKPGPVMSRANLAKLNVWNFNTVRLNLFIEGLGINPSITKIKNYIQTLRSLGLVVIIEPHDYTGKIPDSKQIARIIAWHRQIIEVAKDDPYVWLNLMNEPGNDTTNKTAEQWRDSQLQIITALRKLDPERMLIVDAPNVGIDDPDTPNFTHSAILKYGNEIRKNDPHLVFSLHTWWGWDNQAQSKIRAYLSKIKTANLPLIFGEFGGDRMNAAKATVSIAHEQGIGWLVWEWFGDATNYLVQKPQKRGYLINHNSQPTNLTELGQLVWNYTHSHK